MNTLVEAATRLRPRRTSGRRPALLTALCLLAVPVAGCGGDDGGGGGSKDTVPAAQATVKAIEVTGFGKVLATRAGKSLYVISGRSGACTGACLKGFKALAASGEPSGADGIETDLLGTKGTQVTYADQALYTHTGRGKVSGAGLKAKGGGTWFLVGTDGKAIEQTEKGGY